MANGHVLSVDLVEHIANVAAWLDRHDDDSDLTPMTCQSLRILKVSEEAGEVARAWIGATGQNPRKGFTHTSGDVVNELADVVLAALVAIHSLGDDPAAAVHDRMVETAKRLRDGSA